MTEEQITNKKEYAGEKKPSMKRRDDHNDYNGRRIYMITLETAGRQQLFGEVTGDALAPAGSANAPQIILSELGQAIQDEWNGIHNYYPQIDVMAVQMMPDHMHGILFVKAPLPVHLGQVISSFKAGCRKRLRALAAAPRTATGIAAAKPHPTENTAAAPQTTAQNYQHAMPKNYQQALPKNYQQALPKNSSQAMPKNYQQALPKNSSQALPKNSSQATALPLLFEKGYNDLILRSYDELPVWLNYLRDNPRRLLMKRTRPDWLRPFFGLRVAGRTYSAIGNRELLSAPQRLPVRVSRRMSESEIEAIIHRYIEAARNGAVLVSPAISPGEKRVMRTAFNAGLPTIVILENGFTPLSKPHGEQFYACAQGRLLMLAPWEHHNERRTLTAEQCKQLNLMAIDICSPFSPL